MPGNKLEIRYALQRLCFDCLLPEENVENVKNVKITKATQMTKMTKMLNMYFFYQNVEH